MIPKDARPTGHPGIYAFDGKRGHYLIVAKHCPTPDDFFARIETMTSNTIRTVIDRRRSILDELRAEHIEIGPPRKPRGGAVTRRRRMKAPEIDHHDFHDYEDDPASPGSCAHCGAGQMDWLHIGER